MSNPVPRDDLGNLVIGSGDHLLDRGYADPGETRLKFELSARIASEIERQGLSHAAAASLVGLDPTDMTRIANGIVGEFSVYRLMSVLAATGKEIAIEIGDAAPEYTGSIYVVAVPDLENEVPASRQSIPGLRDR